MNVTTEPVVHLSPRPRLTAIAASPADVVRAAGGWLFDQAIAGWDVSVLTAQPGDPRPLRILGTRSHALDAVLASRVPWGACLQVIAVAADLYDADERVRRITRNALMASPAELLLWGGQDRADRGGDATIVQYQPSLAARAFKAQALAAARAGGGMTADVEVFLSLHGPVLAARYPYRPGSRVSPLDSPGASEAARPCEAHLRHHARLPVPLSSSASWQ
jgi:hypothetical protein